MGTATTSPTITFGDDRSAGSDTAWRWITAQSWPGWTVDVVRVTDPDPSIEALFSHEPLHEEHPSDARVAPESSGITAVRHLTTAYDPRIILNEKRDGALLVVGARGRGLLKSMHIGSTAEWLMRCPGSPLVVARTDAAVQRVVACVDGSSHARAAVEALARLPWIAGRAVTVMTVLATDDEVTDHARESASILESAGAHVDVSLVGPDRLAVVRSPAYAILDALDELSPDLVALGTKGLTGLPRIVVGSVAGSVAHYAPCSVLLARQPD